MRVIVIAAKKGLSNWMSPRHLQMSLLSLSREGVLMWTNSVMTALFRFPNSQYQTSKGKTFFLYHLPLALNPPIIWANRVPYFLTMNCPTSPRSHYLSFLPPPRFLCLLHLYLLFDRLPSNKLLKGSVRQRFLEKTHASHPTLVQKLLPVIFAEVRLFTRTQFHTCTDLGSFSSQDKMRRCTSSLCQLRT
jgi:hypothetical protein